MPENLRVIIIAGPNGAGKTTFAREFLPVDAACPVFVNAFARVAQRVKQGGHDIPEAVIRRRFAAGLANFEHLYAPRVDAWALYDNSGEQPVLLDWSERT